MMSNLSFDWNDTLRVAKFMDYDPENNDKQKQGMMNVKDCIKIIDDNLTEDEINKAYFYYVLGCRVADKYKDFPPKEIMEWCKFNLVVSILGAFSKTEMKAAVLR